MRNIPIAEKSERELLDDHIELWEGISKEILSKDDIFTTMSIDKKNQPVSSCFLCSIALREYEKHEYHDKLNFCDFCPLFRLWGVVKEDQICTCIDSTNTIFEMWEINDGNYESLYYAQLIANRVKELF